MSIDNHPASLDLPWLYEQVNDHRTSTMKLYVWFQFHLDGWNLRIQRMADFVIYGLFVGLLALIAGKIQTTLPVWGILAFVVFLFSTVIWPDPLAPQYSASVHFWLLSFIGSAYLLFAKRQRTLTTIFACLISVCSIYSFAAGFATSLITLAAFCIFKGTRLKAVSPTERRREITQLMAAIVIVGGALVSWIVDYHKPAYIPAMALPHQKIFWDFFLNVLSFSFGVNSMSDVVGIICLLIVLIPIVGQIWQQKGRLSNAQWCLFTITFAVLADLCAVSIGRANGFGAGWSKVGEYPEHGMPLIVLSAVNWAMFLKTAKLRVPIIAALWLFCFAAFADNWDFDRYLRSATTDLQTYQCVESYYAGIGDGHCRGTFGDYPHPEALLNNARRLNMSFYTEMTGDIRRKQDAIP